MGMFWGLGGAGGERVGDGWGVVSEEELMANLSGMCICIFEVLFWVVSLSSIVLENNRVGDAHPTFVCKVPILHNNPFSTSTYLQVEVQALAPYPK